ncbi:hypothetical protein LEP1GSC185_3885 [Leptospira licerasiae serovar Varillal str. VAR 010]|nr:hypothetical protein LEP1GSC185_3885 [Leptospira licerasiae serovar Varillal str. VAR 010]
MISKSFIQSAPFVTGMEMCKFILSKILHLSSIAKQIFNQKKYELPKIN